MPPAVHDYIEASTPNNLRCPARHRSCHPEKHGTWKITPLRRIIFQILMCLGSMLNVQGCNPLVDGTNLAALGFWYTPAIRNWVFQSHLTFPPSGNPCCQSRYSLRGRVVRPDTRGPGWEPISAKSFIYLKVAMLEYIKSALVSSWDTDEERITSFRISGVVDVHQPCCIGDLLQSSKFLKVKAFLQGIPLAKDGRFPGKSCDPPMKLPNPSQSDFDCWWLHFDKFAYLYLPLLWIQLKSGLHVYYNIKL